MVDERIRVDSSARISYSWIVAPEPTAHVKWHCIKINHSWLFGRISFAKSEKYLRKIRLRELKYRRHAKRIIRSKWQFEFFNDDNIDVADCLLII